ncbi:MAG TPA: hypothetical protein VJP80_04050 [Candidatus Saccharimonadales bacterium]|nr:hypothetical protein [Candidatus Saccharimonadales bacterium]
MKESDFFQPDQYVDATSQHYIGEMASERAVRDGWHTTPGIYLFADSQPISEGIGAIHVVYNVIDMPPTGYINVSERNEDGYHGQHYRISHPAESGESWRLERQPDGPNPTELAGDLDALARLASVVAEFYGDENPDKSLFSKGSASLAPFTQAHAPSGVPELRVLVQEAQTIAYLLGGNPELIRPEM